jgi:hypothetical protein
METRHCDHYPAGVTPRAAQPDIIRRLGDYALGYADGQAERRR